MITNEKKIDALTNAAMTIFAFYERGLGFYSGIRYNPETDRKEVVYNNWDAGLGKSIAIKLGRPINSYEQTILSLAVGRGPTPALTKQERKYSMEFLWDSEYPSNPDNLCRDLMRVLTSF